MSWFSRKYPISRLWHSVGYLSVPLPFPVVPASLFYFMKNVVQCCKFYSQYSLLPNRHLEDPASCPLFFSNLLIIHQVKATEMNRDGGLEM